MRGGVPVLLLLTAALPIAGNTQDASDAASRWDAVVKCAALRSTDSRHTCVDDVLRGAGLLPSSAAERRESFGLQKPPSPPEPKPAVPPAPAREATAPPPADPRQLEVTLASATQAADGKLVLVTTEGAVWRQSESQTIRWLPVQGDAMKIEKTTFGGFLCSLGKGTVFRCRRTR